MWWTYSYNGVFEYLVCLLLFANDNQAHASYTETATLIDNKFTNNVSTEDYYTKGILLCDITDHFPVYHITNKVIQTEETVCIHQRKMNDSCKQQFLNSLSTCEWNHVMERNDAQGAYSKFSEAYQSIYDKCFPKYISKKRYDNKLPWLSEA